jgi:hypothetical protein|uniref:Uncharacterized protein n=1 Tax=Picea glauca TaxID=3330 RepID=A0A101LX34_PICGL|nr:hypothetical protein ABT39_MTgene6390 [Picea glauca]QHR86281.1 hypothetical protein Q903MT_gene280 [Picea sitchensis]
MLLSLPLPLLDPPEHEQELGLDQELEALLLLGLQVLLVVLHLLLDLLNRLLELLLGIDIDIDMHYI